jgi:ParB-like chromosome segregation protein Spo0J
MKLTIDSEFRSLIPPLSDEERSQLESNIVANGCRDSLVTWGKDNVLLDGHHRYEICTRLGIEFDIVRIEFEDNDAAREWMIRNQFGRRNLEPFARARLALVLEPLIAAKAKERVKIGGAKGGEAKGVQKSSHPSKTREEVAKLANMSHDTLRKAKVIEENADEETKAALLAGETNINREYPKAAKAAAEKDPAPKKRRKQKKKNPDALWLSEVARIATMRGKKYDGSFRSAFEGFAMQARVLSERVRVEKETK